MKNTLMMKSVVFSLMCVVYILSLAQASASSVIESVGTETNIKSAINETTSKMYPKQKKLDTLENIQKQWLAALDSNGNKRQRFYEMQRVAKKMFKLSLKHPDNASMQAWSGIMLSTFAGASIEGRAEHIAVSAKRLLEKAQQQKIDVLDTSYLNNGMSARTALQHALAYNPSGLNIHKYYGAFIGKDTTKMLALNKRSKTANSTQSVTQVIN